MSAPEDVIEPTSEELVRQLRRENRQLKRELASLRHQLQSTDDLYRTSERVLTKAYRDLEEASARGRELQEKLAQSTRLATIGAVAGQVAHEVLNPMTSLLGRLQSLIQRLEHPREAEPMTLLTDIVSDWETLYIEGQFEAHLHAPSEEESTLFEEDLHDMQTLMKALKDQHRIMVDDLRFLERLSLHTVKLVNNMRSRSRMQVELAPVLFEQVLHDTLELLDEQLRRAAVEVRVNLDPQLPPVLADASQLMQILTNLLNNARQAIRRGGHIEVRGKVDMERVVLLISDDGPGIPLPPEKRDQIFELGFTTRAQEGGSGLGLAICRRLARRYHGDLELVWTEQGKGTCFKLWFPLKLDREKLEESLRREVG